MTRQRQGKGGLTRRGFLRRGALWGAASALAATGPWVQTRASFGLDLVRMACWSPRLAEQTDVFVAEERGFFKDQGIEMKWVPSLGSGDALRNLLAGNADIAFVGPEAVYFAADKGERLKAVYNIYPQNPFNVFALKKHGIIIPEDLRGKKVGIISMASGTRYNLETLLAVNAIKSGEVEMVAVGLNPLPAIQADQIHAMASTDTILYGAHHRGLGPTDVIWVRDYLNLPADVFTVMEKDYAPKREMWRRFLRAYRMGTEWTIKHPKEAVPYGQKLAIDGKDPALVLAHIKLRVIGTAQSQTTRQKGLGWFDLPVLKEGAEVYRKAGLIKNPLDIEGIFTNGLVAEI